MKVGYCGASEETTRNQTKMTPSIFWYYQVRMCVHALYGRVAYLNRFRVYVWTGKYDPKRYVWTRIFSNTEEKTSVFKNTRLHVERNKFLVSSFSWFVLIVNFKFTVSPISAPALERLDT